MFVEILSGIVDVLVRPFVAATILFAILGQFSKSLLFTRRRAAKGSILAWGRKTLPAHPFVSGLILGYLWPGEIEPGYVGGHFSGMLYFGLAGGLSVWSFEVLRGLLKKYQGIDLTIVEVEAETSSVKVVSGKRPSTPRPDDD